MNYDIRLAVGFWLHPKVKKLEKRLGLRGVRSLQFLWCWCAQNRPDGVLRDMDAEAIELASDWHGKAGAFFAECLGAWIDEHDGVYVLHEWQEHNPYQAATAAKNEDLRKKRQDAAMKRWGNKGKSSANGEQGQEKPLEKMPNNANGMQKDMQNTNLHDANDMQNSNLHMQKNANACLPKPIPIPEELKPPLTPPQAGGGTDAPAPASPREEKPESGDKPDQPQEEKPKRAKKPTSYPEDFEAFWRLYPKKVGKDDACRAWKRRKPDLPPIEQLGAILERQSHCEQWQREGGRFIPNPSTWLNQGRWQDAVGEADSDTPPGPHKPQSWERELSEEERLKAQEAREKIMAAWSARKSKAAAP